MQCSARTLCLVGLRPAIGCWPVVIAGRPLVVGSSPLFNSSIAVPVDGCSACQLANRVTRGRVSRRHVQTHSQSARRAYDAYTSDLSIGLTSVRPVAYSGLSTAWLSHTSVQVCDVYTQCAVTSINLLSLPYTCSTAAYIGLQNASLRAYTSSVA